MKHIWKVFADVAVSPESDLTASALFAVFIFVIIAAIVGVIVFFVMKSRKRKASPAAMQPPAHQMPYAMPTVQSPERTDQKAQNDRERS